MEKNQIHILQGSSTATEPRLSLDMELKAKQESDLEAIAKKLDCKEYKYEFNQFEVEVEDEDTVTLRAEVPTPVFFYHPDHLGSSTVISNSAGAVHQYFFNLPFGETMIEGCTNTSYELNYKFNAKELDAESGLYYYGARYYDPRISVWMSVDPMWEANSSISPYVFCSNNPFNRIDPTGMIDRDNDDDIYKYKGKEVVRIKTNKADQEYQVTPNNNGTWTVQNDPLATNLSSATITAPRNKKNFAGVNIITADIGKLKNGAAFTLPNAIFVGKKDIDNFDLLKHEYGHILQYKKFGLKTYLKDIVPTSLKSANKANHITTFNHENTWTEWSANYLSKQFFGNNNWREDIHPTLPTQNRIGIYPSFVSGPFDFIINWLNNDKNK